VCALAPGFFIAGYRTWYQYRRAESELYERVQQAVRVAVRQHHDVVTGVTAVLVSERATISAGAWEHTCDAFRRSFAATALSFVVVERVAGVSRTLCEVSRGGRLPLLEDADQAAVGQALAAGRLTPGSHFLTGDSSGSRLGIVYPIPGRPAYLAVFQPLDWFKGTAEDLGLPSDAVLGLTSADGVVMARYPNDKEWVGRVVADGPLFRQMSGAADSGVTDVLGVDGVSRIYAFSRLTLGTSRPSYLLVGISTVALRQEAVTQITRTGLGFLAAALTAWLLSGLVAERLFLRQSKALVDGARKLADGDFSVRIGSEGRGSAELIQLAHALDTLAAKIQTMQQSESHRYAELSGQAVELRAANAHIEAQRLHLDGLSQELLRAQETERQQIARELHDQMGQSLTALKINLQIERSTRGDSPHLAEGFRIVDGLIAEVRDLALSLRPPLLEEQGLSGAVSYLLSSESKRSGLRTIAKLMIGEARFPPDVELAVFRIIQEAITNAVRHAAATTIVVALECDGRRLDLAIIDDGIGFDVEAVSDAGRGFGLLSMRERATLAKGSFKLTSVPGGGSTIRVSIPVSH